MRAPTENTQGLIFYAAVLYAAVYVGETAIGYFDPPQPTIEQAHDAWLRDAEAQRQSGLEERGLRYGRRLIEQADREAALAAVPQPPLPDLTTEFANPAANLIGWPVPTPAAPPARSSPAEAASHSGTISVGALPTSNERGWVDLSGWTADRNAAISKSNNPNSPDGLGVNFPLDGKGARIVACTGDGAVKGKRSVSVALSIDDKSGTSMVAEATPGTDTCWIAYLPKESLAAIKHGKVMLMTVDSQVFYRADLTGSARALNAAWDYVEKRLSEHARTNTPTEPMSLPAGTPEITSPDIPAAAVSAIGESVELRTIEYLSSGELQGCGIHFSLVSRDYTYANGSLVALGGSLNTLFSPGKSPAWILKIFGKDVRLSRSGDISSTQFPIDYAYLSGPGMSTAGRQIGTFECQDSQTLCIAFGGQEYVTVLSALLSDDLRIAYSRKDGGADAFSPPLSFARMANGSAEREKAGDCLLRIAKKFVDTVSPTKTQYQGGYEWASQNGVAQFSDCQKRFGTSEAENGCNAYVQRTLYGGPRYFKGSQCTEDCSGHEAGYTWAEAQGISDEDDCSGNSESFIEGCRSYVEENY